MKDEAPRIQIIHRLKNIPRNCIVQYQITETEIQNRDISRFVRDCIPSDDTNPTDVQNLFGSVVYSFDADQAAEEIYESKSIRQFVSHVNEAFPCWLFYVLPAPETLMPLLLCSLNQLEVVRTNKSQSVLINYDEEELTRLVLGWVPTAFQLADWAGIPRKRICQRIHHWLVMLLPPEIAKDFARSSQ